MSVKTYKAAIANYRTVGGPYPDYRIHAISERQAQQAESALSRVQTRGPGRFAGKNQRKNERRR